MYIAPFWCGVIVTIAVEFAVILIWGIYKDIKNFKKEKEKMNGSEKEE